MTDRPPTPPTATTGGRSVSFNPIVVNDQDQPTPPSPTDSSNNSSKPTRPIARRRSSLREGTGRNPPEQSTFQHPDPILRRLRLRDSRGKPVGLEHEFRQAKVVVFLFGASWAGSSNESYTIVEAFARKHPHQLKVIYCSVDSSEKAYEVATVGKPWVSMEWNDGSNLTATPSFTPTPSSPNFPPISEPFLLAGDPDLEEDFHTSDPLGTLYLRPWSRVFLAQKFQVLGVPNLVVYHVESGKVLSTHARVASLKGDAGDKTWEKWEKGETVDFEFKDVLVAMKWTLGIGVVAFSYLIAVRLGGAEDLISNMSRNFVAQYFGQP